MPTKPVLSAASKVEGLRRLRDRLAEAIDSPTVSARDLASLSKQYAEVVEAIDRADPPKPERSALDEFNARRAASGKAPARPALPGGRR